MSHADGSSAGGGIDMPEPHRKSIGAEVALATRGSKSSMIVAVEDIIFERLVRAFRIHQVYPAWRGRAEAKLRRFPFPFQSDSIKGDVKFISEEFFLTSAPQRVDAVRASSDEVRRLCQSPAMRRQYSLQVPYPEAIVEGFALFDCIAA